MKILVHQHLSGLFISHAFLTLTFQKSIIKKTKIQLNVRFKVKYFILM